MGLAMSLGMGTALIADDIHEHRQNVIARILASGGEYAVSAAAQMKRALFDNDAVRAVRRVLAKKSNKSRVIRAMTTESFSAMSDLQQGWCLADTVIDDRLREGKLYGFKQRKPSSRLIVQEMTHYLQHGITDYQDPEHEIVTNSTGDRTNGSLFFDPEFEVLERQLILDAQKMIIHYLQQGEDLTLL